MDDMRDIRQNQLGGGKLERRLISSLSNIEGINNFLLVMPQYNEKCAIWPSYETSLNLINYNFKA